MFCAKCGLKNDDTSLFCAGCGSKLITPQQFQQENIEPENLQQETVESDNDISPNEFMFFKQEEPETTNEKADSMNNTDTQVQKDAEAIKAKNKFSVKRFIFSMLVILLAVASCVTIAFNYFSLETNESSAEEAEKEFVKGYEIVKDGVDIDYESGFIEDDYGDALEDYNAAANLVKITAIALFVCLIAFALIEMILLIFVRKRISYVLTFIFTLINLGLSGFLTYSYCFIYLDKCKKIIEYMYDSFGVFFDEEISIRLTANVEPGLILALALQATVMICSIVLMTCKNKLEK